MTVRLSPSTAQNPRRWGLFTLLLAIATLLSPASASLSAQQGLDSQILEELKQIRILLERLVANPEAGRRRPATDPTDAQVAKLSTTRGHILGNPNAPVTIVEFSDLQCPFCREFAMTTFEELKARYIDPGTVRYITREFPMQALHPMALPAAQAVLCADEQGQYWEMRRLILLHNDDLSRVWFGRFASDLKLADDSFSTCMAATDRFADRTRTDMEEAARAGILGTPSFVIGPTGPSGLEGVLVIGAQEYAVFDAAIKKALDKALAR